MSKPIYLPLKDKDKKSSFFDYFKSKPATVKPVFKSDLTPEQEFYEKTGIIKVGSNECTFLLSLLM